MYAFGFMLPTLRKKIPKPAVRILITILIIKKISMVFPLFQITKSNQVNANSNAMQDNCKQTRVTRTKNKPEHNCRESDQSEWDNNHIISFIKSYPEKQQ